MGECFRLDVFPVVGGKVWPRFAEHHYLSSRYNGHRAFLAVLPDGEPVAFTSLIRLPHARLRNAWRGHRTVVLPDLQGLGIGARLSDWLGEYVLTVMDGRFYSRTSHPRLGAYRDASPYWRRTASSGIKRTDKHAMKGTVTGWQIDTTRTAWSHEYLGRNPHEAG